MKVNLHFIFIYQQYICSINNKLLILNLEIMKKVLMLVAVLLGTSVMVNAKTFPTKNAPVKELKVQKHKKHRKARVEKKVATPAMESSKEKQ